MLLDELVAQDALVRVIDAWVAALDMNALRFGKAQPQVMGAPPYDPADLLKLYIWGYLGAVRSSRNLERECRRNIECMWLLGRLTPDHKTIADFRRANTHALVAVCSAFVQFARGHRLIGGSTVAIDGSKVRAVASRKAVIGKRELVAQAQSNAQQIEQYLRLLDAQDCQEAGEQPSGDDVRRALQRLESQQAAIQANLQRLGQSRGLTVVQGESDAQAMHGLHGAPGYNLHTAVETQSHLIVAHQVTNEANDQRQLAPMAEVVSQTLQEPVTVIADAGYANGEHIAQLDAKGITSYVAVKRAVNNQGGGGLYDRSAFGYDAVSDSFICPAGKTLVRKQLSRTGKMVIYAARSDDCAVCSDKTRCTSAPQRYVTRHLYEDALEANSRRVQEKPQMMALRRQTVEHPFDFIKHRSLGNARLLLRGIAGVNAELSLAVLAYNLKRVFNMKGAVWMRQALQG